MIAACTWWFHCCTQPGFGSASCCIMSGCVTPKGMFGAVFGDVSLGSTTVAGPLSVAFPGAVVLTIVWVNEDLWCWLVYVLWYCWGSFGLGNRHLSGSWQLVTVVSVGVWFAISARQAFTCLFALGMWLSNTGSQGNWFLWLLLN